MSEVKQRGPQYLLFVLIILTWLAIGNFLKPKSPVKKKVTTKTSQKKMAQKSLEPVSSKKTKEGVEEDSLENNQIIPVKSKSDIDYWYKSLLAKYTANTEDLSYHHDVVIRYYRKPADVNKIDSLKSLGFYIHERPTKKELKSFYTNTIYYGDSIRREDVLVVAYQLKIAGFRLQAIEHSRFGDNWKSHSIELGTDTTMLTKPELTLDTIKYIVENNPFIKARM